MTLKGNKWLHLAGAAFAVVLGLVVIYWGFELVSLPHVHEYAEKWYVVLGLFLVIAGAAHGVFRGIKRKPSE